MPGESLSFPIIAEDRASSKFRDVGNAALAASGKIDIAAASLKLFNDTSIKSGRAADSMTNAFKQHTAANKLLIDSFNVLTGRQTEFTKLEADTSRVLDDTAKKAATAAGPAGLGALIGGGGLQGGGMGGLIAAGVALAPVLVTTGVGLAGLAAAAVGIYKPISSAAQATGGLRANMATLNPEQQAVARGILALGQNFAGFQKQLEPTVLGLFVQGLRLAATLLHSIEPVAAATGKALGGVIGQLNTTFRSQEWTQFFSFMKQTAASDVKQLGQTFIDLLNALPPLIQDLQPLAVGLLHVADAAARVVGVIGHAPGLFNDTADALANLNQSTVPTNKSIDTMGAAITQAGLRTQLAGNIVSIASDTFHGAGAALRFLAGQAGPTAKTLGTTGVNAHAAAMSIQAIATAVTTLSTAQSKALGNLTTYAGDLLTSKTDALAFERALDKSRGQIGLHTAAQRASFAAANTYITDLSNTATQAIAAGKGVGGAIAAIRTGLPILDAAKTKNRLYWQEVKTLHDWLVKLQQLQAIRETVFVTGSGTFTVRPGTKLGLPGGSAGGPFATGGKVPPGFPGDTYLARLTSGESVVPTHLTPAVAPFLKAHGVPGFAGGLVGSYSGNVAGLVPWSRHDLNATVGIFEQVTAKATFAAMKAASAAAARFFSAGGGGPVSASAAQAQAYARSRLGAFGWGGGEMGPLIALWNQESGWNRFARNPTSGAYGIPQALPPGKMGAAANPPTSSAGAQINWGLGYIRSVYGSPSAAEGHELAHGWYDHGGWLPTGVSLAVNTSGRPEMVVPYRGGAGVRLQLEWVGGNAGDHLLQWIQKNVRIRGGGSVQKAFGRP